MRSSQLLKGVLELAVMVALRDGPSYGLELLERLRAAGLKSVGDASIYGVLKRLEGEGTLGAELVPSTAGPARKYYSLTGPGSAVLADAASEWQTIVATMSRLTGDDSDSQRSA